jgi:hypothetical protein
MVNMKTQTLLVFNPKALPEFDGRTEEAEYRAENPFAGIEVVGTYNTDAEINRKIDQMWSKDRDLKFHIS